MKKLYTLALSFLSFGLFAQTTVQYPQQAENYNAFFSDSGGHFNQNSDEFGMWANGGGAKQSVAWRSFTETGLPGGTPSTMAVGDSFTITVSATQASYGQIGVALLSNPSTTSWDDRVSNYAVQVNLNGNSGANDPWEVVSNGGTINASSIGGSTNYADFKFQFTLNSTNTMTVSINDGAEVFNITLNNTDITGYSVYFADDWNGAANANIYWKPVTEYTYASTLSINDVNVFPIKLHPNPVNDSFKTNKSLNGLHIYDITGKLVKSFTGEFTKNDSYDISSLTNGMYLVKIENENGESITSKLVKL
ncbi:T9SS type A sorting domain-containing protein [Gaetbulibacter jejuensis]|uniref:T9SS type A sorting domain-containing protein n=1 Tax=Gaetbulibacter jejuensis TaxID=584607 RepID=UPI00300B9AA1